MLDCPDDRWAFAVGDVAGKSAAAALFGSMAVGIMRGNVIELAGTPAAMLAYLNEQLCRLHEALAGLSFHLRSADRDRASGGHRIAHP